MVWYCILYNICFYEQVLKILKPQVRDLTQSSEFIYKNSSTLCIVSGLYVFALRGLDGQLNYLPHPTKNSKYFKNNYNLSKSQKFHISKLHA